MKLYLLKTREGRKSRDNMRDLLASHSLTTVKRAILGELRAHDDAHMYIHEPALPTSDQWLELCACRTATEINNILTNGYVAEYTLDEII